ncbi:polysaccharide deacetylase family protein [Rhodoferax sp. U2-2l]|uniref:polysaccharide deacetylase family protein n=1 Tax=Rhodoferax sp. U2-2l TaxID=2884000 RepID=UPI001D0A5FAE|nr:polysaccharide deacetylase family protein [Rhodoferax sp. U2-2l]MCB8747169.1 polysaccharide deacetylase family protein [Rhodoferax sp. U2-2l]
MLNLPSHTPVATPVAAPPVLTVVVDTEEEFDWSQPFSRGNTRTQSIAAQPLAHQRVFDKHGVVPTYVIDWPVATHPQAVQVLKALMEAGQCDIGTHLHPWVSPPHDEEVNTFNSYAGNLPPELEYQKLDQLTTAIATSFGKRPIVFKAGRYGVGPHTADTIARLGYLIDASVVPYTDMRGDGGPDFSGHGVQPYWFTAHGQTLLELPATAGYAGRLHQQGRWLYPALQTPWAKRLRLPGMASRAGLLERVKLTPEGYSAQELIHLTRCLYDQGCRFFGLTYHSPSLVPGNTPYVRSQEDLTKFLSVLDDYITFFLNEFGGQTLSAASYRQHALSQFV